MSKLPRPRLRRYQAAPALAIVRSVAERDGKVFAVTMARQAGKNELSAWVEMTLLSGNAAEAVTGVKAAPTKMPQANISRDRLSEMLSRFGMRHSVTDPYVYVGRARWGFLSAEKGSNVVGHTVGLALECDEAQDVDRAKWEKEFAPMAATTNATRVFYGTPWVEDDLLGEALASADGVYRVPWTVVAEENRLYARYVEGERARLGANHPLFLTQYELQMLPGAGRLLSAAQLAQILSGDHPRRELPQDGEAYVAGLDVAGADDGTVLQGRDSTVLTIGRVVFSTSKEPPRVEVVAMYTATGEGHATLFPLLAGLLGQTWRVRLVAVDATTLGEAFGLYLERALGVDKVRNVRFTQASKSALGFGLQAAATTGRLRMWRNDQTAEYVEAAAQLRACRAEYLPNRMVRWSVPSAEGHDDIAVSLALLVQASEEARPLSSAIGSRRRKG